ncbi:hypothetical protein SLEP1_g10896 [Rubroshorea leprosula]|uniref:Uncharacterized protein n=1 Tax=Rubroshorea leprosula TaxID=152421 RepID=A0AAV5IE23_9ROSI|nr:hypothetical protein SLEP1_g10896 [Rubroshorea leprosula]
MRELTENLFSFSVFFQIWAMRRPSMTTNDCPNHCDNPHLLLENP